MAGVPRGNQQQDKRGYSVADRSLLLPLLKPRVWEPIVGYIPAWVSANSISLVGSLFALAALIVALQTDPAQPGWYALSGLFVFIYTNLDNLDGAHARRTGRCAPMGEFIDHWLDTANSGVVIWAVAIALQLPAWAILVLLASNATAFHGTFAEQQTTGNLYMGPFGNLEGLMLASALLVAIGQLGTDLFAHRQWLGPVTIAWALTAWSVLMNTWTAASTASRCDGGHSSWVPMLLSMSAAITWQVVGDVPLLPIAALLVLCNTVYTGRRIVAHVLGEANPRLGGFTFAVMTAAAAVCLLLDLPAVAQEGVAWASVVLVTGRVAADFVRTARTRSMDLQPDEFLGWFFAR